MDRRKNIIILLGRCTNSLPARSKKGKNFENQSKIRTSGVTNKEYRAFRAFGTESPSIVPIVPTFRSLIVPILRSLIVPTFRSLIVPLSFLSCHRSLICIVPIVPFIVPIVLLSRHETLRNNGLRAFCNNNYVNLSLSVMKGHKNKNVSIENHFSMLYFGDPIQHVHELFPPLADKMVRSCSI